MSVHLPILVIINHKVLSSDFRALSVCKLAISTSQPGKHTVTVHNDHQSPALRTRNVRMQTSLPLLKKKKKKEEEEEEEEEKEYPIYYRQADRTTRPCFVAKARPAPLTAHLHEADAKKEQKNAASPCRHVML